MDIKKILSRAIDRLPLRRRLLYIFSTNLAVASACLNAKTPDGLTTAESNDAQLEETAALFGEPAKIAMFKRRRAAGRRCFVLLKESRVIGCRWLSTTVDPELEGTVPLRLQKDEGYFFDVFMAPKWRGSGAYQALCRATFDLARAEGLTHSLGVVVSSNIASLASVSRFSTLVAAVEQRRWPFQWQVRAVRAVALAEAAALGARFKSPAAVNVDAAWLSKRGALLHAQTDA